MFTFLRKNKKPVDIIFLLSLIFSCYTNVFSSVLNVTDLDKILVTRESYLSKIRHLLEKGESIVVLAGASGVGKTQLSKDYISKYGEQYEIVWWFNDNDSFFDQLKQFSRALNKSIGANIEIDQTSQEYLEYQVKEFLRETEKKWLLIYDDVVDYDRIKNYIFQNRRKSCGHIIITSKNILCWNNVINVRKFNRRESLDLIKKITKLEDNQGMDALAKMLDDYPLAISQAATFMKLTGTPHFQEYIDKFMNARNVLWEKEEKIYDQNSQLHDSHATIHTTMKMSLENLRNKSISAYKFYKCIGMLNKKNMYNQLLQEIHSYINDGVDDDILFQNDINLIIAEGLLDRDYQYGEITFSRHDMFQFALEDFITDPEKRDYIKAISFALSKLSDLHWDKLVEYLSKNPSWSIQADTLIYNSQKFEILNEDIIKIKIRILEYNTYHNRDHKLYEQQVLDISHSLKSVSIDDFERAKFYIDSVYDRKIYQENVWQQAEKNMNWALDTLRKSNDTNEYFRSLINIANFYFFLNDTDKSLSYLEKADLLKEKVQSKSYLNLFFYIYGWILTENGKHEKAYDQIHSFLNNYEPNTGSSLRLLILTLGANCQFKLGDYEKASNFANQAIQGAKKLYKNEANEVMALSLLILAKCHKIKNDFSKAEELAKKAKCIYVDFFGGDGRHPDQAISYVILGDIYSHKGLNAAALTEYMEAENILNSVVDNKKSLKFSEVYEKIYYLGLKMNNEQVVNSYFQKHKDTFGIQNEMTLQMASDLPT